MKIFSNDKVLMKVVSDLIKGKNTTQTGYKLFEVYLNQFVKRKKEFLEVLKTLIKDDNLKTHKRLFWIFFQSVRNYEVLFLIYKELDTEKVSSSDILKEAH